LLVSCGNQTINPGQGSANGDQSSGKKYQVDSANITNVVFHVEGMSCNNCSNLINTEMGSKPGITSCKASFAGKNCQISYDKTKYTEAQLIVLLDKLNFKASTLSPMPENQRKPPPPK